jgi:Uma2 family endonuclease
VLSGNAKHDRIVKAPLYAAMNVQHLWLIDPKALTLEVYTLRDRVYEQTLTARGADMVRAAPFEELELSLATLWLKPPA